MTKCRYCHWPMTWAQQRRQYGRMIRRGLTPEEIKQIQPACQTCVTRQIGDGRRKEVRSPTRLAPAEARGPGRQPPRPANGTAADSESVGLAENQRQK